MSRKANIIVAWFFSLLAYGVLAHSANAETPPKTSTSDSYNDLGEFSTSLVTATSCAKLSVMSEANSQRLPCEFLVEGKFKDMASGKETPFEFKQDSSMSQAAD